MNTRPLTFALAAVVGLCLSAGCAPAAPLSSPDDGPGAAERRQRLSASEPDTGTGHPPVERTTPSASPASHHDGLLFYADGQIHAGGKVVATYNQGSTTSTITHVESTASGWLLEETYSHVGGELVLLGSDGSTLQRFSSDNVTPEWFDVSDDGSRVALLSGSRVFLIDTATGDRVDTIAPSTRSVNSVQYAGENLVITSTGRTMLWETDSSSARDLYFSQPGRIAQLKDVSTDGQVALVNSSVRTGAVPCLTAVAVDVAVVRKWSECDVAAYAGALNADGSRVITIAATLDQSWYYRTDGIGYGPASLQVTDIDSGEQVASIDPPGELLHATWTADGTIVVKTANDRSPSGYRISECVVGGACETVATARHAGLGHVG